MDNNKDSQNNNINQSNEENPLKYVDEFKNICHNMFKNFLDQNLYSIVDDVYKKFSDKMRPETGELSRNELREDFQQMMNSAINETIKSKTDEIDSSINIQSDSKIDNSLLMKKKKREESYNQNENEDKINSGSESDLKKKDRKQIINDIVSEKSENDNKSSLNLSLDEQRNLSIVNSEEIKILKNDLLNKGKGSLKSKFKINEANSKLEKKIELEPVLDNANYEKNINYKKFKSEEERINVYENLNKNEEDFFIKYLKDKIKNDQPFRILVELSQKCKFNTPEVIINSIGKNDQFSVKIFISDFYFYGDGLAQSKKEGKKLAAYDMLDKLLNFKDSRSSCINAICNIFKIDKFKLIQQSKELIKENKFDKGLINSNLQNIDLNKDIQDLEKILENIKYEYKLSSHIARFHKYIDDKKTYIVKIKINDEPFLEEKGSREESTYKKSLKETIKKLRNKYILGISEENFNDLNGKEDQSEFDQIQANNTIQNYNMNNQMSLCPDPNQNSSQIDFVNYRDNDTFNNSQNITIKERKNLNQNKRRKLEIDSNIQNQMNFNICDYPYDDNYNQNNQEMNFYTNNILKNNFVEPNAYNNFENINHPVDNNFSNNYIPKYNNMYVENNFNHGLPFNNYIISQDHIRPCMFPNEENRNLQLKTKIDMLEGVSTNINPLLNDTFNISSVNPLQNLPNFSNNLINDNEKIIDNKLAPNIEPNTMNSFLNNYNSNSLMNNLNKIKQTQKDNKTHNAFNINQTFNNSEQIDDIPIINPLSTINTTENKTNDINNNQSLKDKNKFCDKYELSSERSEKNNTNKDLPESSLNENSLKGCQEKSTNDLNKEINEKLDNNHKSTKRLVIEEDSNERELVNQNDGDTIKVNMKKENENDILDKNKSKDSDFHYYSITEEIEKQMRANTKSKIAEFEPKSLNNSSDKTDNKGKLTDSENSIKESKSAKNQLRYSNIKIENEESINKNRKKSPSINSDPKTHNIQETPKKNDRDNKNTKITNSSQNENDFRKNKKEKMKQSNDLNIQHTNIPSNPLKPKKKKQDPEMEKINKNWKSNLSNIEKLKEKEFFERFDSKENSDRDYSLIEESESSFKDLDQEVNSLLESQEEISNKENKNKKNTYEFMKSPTLSAKSNKKDIVNKESLNSPKNNIKKNNDQENSFIKKIKNIDEKIDKKLETLQAEKKTTKVDTNKINSNKIEELIKAKNNVKQLINKEKKANMDSYKNEQNKEIEKGNIIKCNFEIKDKVIRMPTIIKISDEIDKVEKVLEKIKAHKGDNLQRNFEIFCLRLEKSVETKTFLYNDYINEYLNILINLSKRLKIGYSFIGSFYLNILRRDELNIDAILGDSNNDTKKIDIMFFIKNEFKNFFTTLYPNKQSNVSVTNENNKTKIKISIINNPLTLTLYFINSGIEFYEDLSDYKKFINESEENISGPDFSILATLLRLWRKRFNLFFLPVEFLDFLIVNYKSELISDTIARIFVLLMKQSVFSIAEKYYESKKVIGNKWALNITRIIDASERCIELIKQEKFREIFIQEN